MRYIKYYAVISASVILLSCTSRNDIRTDVKPGSGGDQITKQELVKEEISINTADSVVLAGNYYYFKDDKSQKQPAVILIHQFRSSKEQWNKSFIDSLANAGYKVLTYDIRGHGQSSKVKYDLRELLTDPYKAPNDIIAVFKWMQEQQGIDTTQIGVIGTSIGGSLACYARYFLGAKAIVGISNGRPTFEKFVGIDDRMMGRMFPRITNVLFICGKNDDQIAEGEKHLMDMYIGDPKELKVYDSDKHGKDLVEQHPEIYSLALEWLKKYL
jgi:dienelactone hydrolase